MSTNFITWAGEQKYITGLDQTGPTCNKKAGSNEPALCLIMLTYIMPPMSGPAGMAGSGLGISTMVASVVSK